MFPVTICLVPLMSIDHLLCLRLRVLLLHTAFTKLKTVPRPQPSVFIYFFFCNYLLSDYCLPGTAIGAEDLAGKKMDRISAFIELIVQWRRQT